jgi:hypothetical protein
MRIEGEARGKRKKKKPTIKISPRPDSVPVGEELAASLGPAPLLAAPDARARDHKERKKEK